MSLHPETITENKNSGSREILMGVFSEELSDKNIMEGVEESLEDLQIETDNLEKKLKELPMLSERNHMIESMTSGEIENVLQDISDKINDSGLFEDMRNEGINVWLPRLQDSQLPFPFAFKDNPAYSKLLSEDNNVGSAVYDYGKIIVHATPPSLQSRLSNWASGYNGDYLLEHETIHGFQVGNVEMAQEFGALAYKYTTRDSSMEDIHPKINDVIELLQVKWANKLQIKPTQVGEYISGGRFDERGQKYRLKSALREAHAYWKQVNAGLIDNRERGIVNALKSDGYKIEESVAENAVQCIKQLKALGMGDRAIGKIIFNMNINLNSDNNFSELQQLINETIKEKNISEENMTKLSKLNDLREKRDLMQLQYIANEELQKEYIGKLKNRINENLSRVKQLAIGWFAKL